MAEEITTTVDTGTEALGENTTSEDVVDQTTETSSEGDEQTTDVSLSTEQEQKEDGEQEANAEEGANGSAPVQGVLKVKVNGEEVNYDLTDEATLKEVANLISHSSAANKRMQEASQMQKQSVEFLKLLQSNPIDVLTDERLGIDFRQVAEAYLMEQIQLDEMDEGSRDNYNKARQFERMQKQQEFEAEQNTLQTEQQATNDLAVQIKSEIENSIMEGGIPLNDSTFEQVRAIMFANAQSGIETTAVQAVELLQTSLRSIMSDSKDEDLIKVLGEENVKRTRKPAPKEQRVKPEDQGTAKERGKTKKKKMSVTEWRHSLGI